jgi:hypothetical protein
MTQKLDIGGVLRRVFQTYGSQAGVLLPAALIVFVAVGILAVLATLLGGAIGGVIGILIGTLLAALIALVGIYLFQGMVVQLVRDIQDGRRDFSMGQLFGSARPAVPSLIAAGLLIGLAIYVPTFLVSLISRPLGNLVGIILGLFLATIWAVVVPVIVVERSGVIPAFGRSREHVRGSGWQVLAVIVVLAVLLGIAAAVFVAILTGITRSLVGFAIGEVIALVLAAPLWALAAPTMYFQLRALKEGAVAAPAAVGPAPSGASATGAGPGTAPGQPAEPAAPSQAPPPGAAGTTPEGPARHRHPKPRPGELGARRNRVLGRSGRHRRLTPRRVRWPRTATQGLAAVTDRCATDIGSPRHPLR